MTNQQAFEKWYTETYWDFTKVERPKVSYDKNNDSYNHYDVDLAWNAWCAAKVDVFKACL